MVNWKDVIIMLSALVMGITAIALHDVESIFMQCICVILLFCGFGILCYGLLTSMNSVSDAIYK